MNQIFDNKTVIITGASAGVGAACAHAFAHEGANLVLAARGQEALDNIGEDLASKTEVLTQAMNVADDIACAALLENARNRFGGIHVLINNAGTHSRGDVSTVGAKGIAAMVDVNLRAPLILSALATPYLEQAGGGAIVMVGSLAGRTPMQGAATYAATKAGLRSFTYGFADEVVEKGIHVGLVSPGPIDTGFIMDEIDEVEDIVFSQPISTATEVAAAVLSVARGEQTEICLPALSGRMTTLSYLFPGLRRRMRPKLYSMGRKNKDKYRKR